MINEYRANLAKITGCYNAKMRSRVMWFVLGILLTALIIVGVYQIPFVKDQLEWRLDAAGGIVRGLIYPGNTLPVPSGAEAAAIPPTSVPSSTLEGEETSVEVLPTLTPTPLPSIVSLESPEWEKQDWNNCGPATLAIGLKYFGWDGDQYSISDLVKPDRGDRNVNIDELVYFVNNRAGWLTADYRVNGTIDILKGFIAAGYPVVVEKGYIIESDGPDAGWAGHYLLLTGYDDNEALFIAQDSFIGPDQEVTYAALDEGWRAFNRAYLYFYPADRPPDLEGILGDDLDPEKNRERALEVARTEIEADADDPFAWFNLGTNLLFFERYREAANAFDSALEIGLPWRFTRYQFGPYIAYFHQGREEDVIELADATLHRTSKAEESMLWRGWARYRLGDINGAIEDFQAALTVNPNYLDAQYALSYLGVGG